MLLNNLCLFAAVLGMAALVTDRQAHRDELTARRFGELNPQTVLSDLDKSRNKRWHAVGLQQRLIFAVLIGLLAGAYRQSWLVAGWATWVAGFATMALFDVDFNIRLRLKAFYTGVTSLVDVATGEKASLVFYTKLAGVVVGFLATFLL